MSNTNVKTQIPNWAARELSESDLVEIEAAVAKVEASTLAEIVPILVRRSAHTGHAIWQILFLLLAMFFAAQTFDLEIAYRATPGQWIILDFIVIFGAAFGLSRWPWLALQCVPHGDRFHQVHDRAEIEFFEQHVMDTKTHNGILIFVSLLEKRAVVLADDTIAKKVPDQAWTEVCDLLVTGIRDHSLKEGYVRALAKCEQILKPVLPSTGAHDVELPNSLVIKA